MRSAEFIPLCFGNEETRGMNSALHIVRLDKATAARRAAVLRRRNLYGPPASITSLVAPLEAARTAQARRPYQARTWTAAGPTHLISSISQQLFKFKS